MLWKVKYQDVEFSKKRANSVVSALREANVSFGGI